MSRPTGLPKSGGRQKGTPNKRTLILQDVLESCQLDVPRRLVELLPVLNQEQELRVLLTFLGYLFPKRKAVDDVMAQADTNSLEESKANRQHALGLLIRKIGQFEATPTEAGHFERVAEILIKKSGIPCLELDEETEVVNS